MDAFNPIERPSESAEVIALKTEVRNIQQAINIENRGEKTPDQIISGMMGDLVNAFLNLKKKMEEDQAWEAIKSVFVNVISYAENDPLNEIVRANRVEQVLLSKHPEFTRLLVAELWK